MRFSPPAHLEILLVIHSPTQMLVILLEPYAGLTLLRKHEEVVLVVVAGFLSIWQFYLLFKKISIFIEIKIAFFDLLVR